MDEKVFKVKFDGVEESIEQSTKLRDIFGNIEETYTKVTKKVEELSVSISDNTKQNKENIKSLTAKQKATEKLKENLSLLGEKIDSASNTTKTFLDIFKLGANTLQLFGIESEKTEKILSGISKITEVVNTLQSINNNLLIKSAGISKSAALMEGVHTMQVRARAIAISLANKNTITATIAQRIFNAVAKANPYVLIALGATAAIAAIAGFIKIVNDGTEAQKKYASAIDKVTFATKEARDAHDSHLREMRDLGIEYDVITGKLTEYEATLKRINNQKLDKIAEAVNATNDALAESKEKADELENIQFLKWVSPAGSAYLLYKQNEAKESEKIAKETKDSENRIREDANASALEIEKNAAAKRKEQQEELQKQLSADLLKGKERELAILKIQEEKEVKQYSDTGLDTVNVRKKYSNQRAEIEERYRKEAIDKARQHAENLKQIEKSIQKYESDTLELKNKTRDSEIEFNKSIASSVNSITLAYEAQKKTIKENETQAIEAAKKENENLLKVAKGSDRERLEKDLADRIIAINTQTADEILNVNNERDNKIKEFNQKILDNRKKLLDLELLEFENFYNDIQRLKEKAEVKDSNGIINVEATKKNLEQIDIQLNQYVTQLQNSKDKVSQYYDDLASLYKSDSIEYKEIQKQKTDTLKDIENKTQNTNKQITDNVKESTDLQKKYFESLGNVIQKYTDAIMQGVNAIFDTVNSSLQAQVDDANEKLETISSKYDEAVSNREESDQKIQELEEKAKNATGTRLIAYRKAIDEEMTANKQLASQEKQLAKDKAKQEAEIAKKEKQQKKVQLMSDIVNATTNIALGVTKALGQWGFPLGPIFASVIAASGAVQIGIMTKQLSKLEDGGLLKGKRHSQGGMRVEGTNIEVEGGEYVVNRESTDKNLGLIRYINSQRKQLTPNDINNYFNRPTYSYEPPFSRQFETGGELPIINNSVNVNNEALVDAIRSVKFEPKVAVTDIMRVQDEMTSVDGWTGM